MKIREDAQRRRLGRSNPPRASADLCSSPSGRARNHRALTRSGRRKNAKFAPPCSTRRRPSAVTRVRA